ncbi:MAG: VTT domain-containing protein [Candidatus Thorarchaeota archaeon]
MRRSDQLLILSVVGLLVYFILGLLFPELASPFAVVYDILLDISFALGYTGALIIAFLGNATILFPFPYIGIPFILGGLTDEMTSLFVFDPWLIGLVAGIGALAGEMTGYFIGYGGGKLIDQEKTGSFKNFIDSHPKATPLVLWFLAATPVPDDILIVPLGAARYPWWKVALPQFIGKTMFMTAIAWAGRFGLDIVENIFGGTNPLSLVSRALEVAALLSVIIAVYLLVRIDWDKLISKTD